MSPVSDQLKGTLIMVAAVVVLSPDALLISVVSADPWTLIFWRGLLTTLTLSVAILTGYGAHGPYLVRQAGLAGLLAGTFFAGSTISFVMSVRLTTAANTLVIIAAMPLFAAVLTRLFLGEPVPTRTWLAVAAGLGGISLVFAGSVSGGSPAGDLLALATALLMASNFVIIRKFRHVNMIPAVILSGMITSTFTLFMTDPLAVGSGDILLLSAMGAVVLPVPLALMTIGPKLIPAAEVGLIMLLETFLGPLWVWMAIGERPGTETLMGGTVLVTTLALHALAGRRGSGAGGRV